jgi:hypothetical protein
MWMSWMWGPCPACGRELDCGDRPVECEPWNGMWLIVGGEKLGDEDEVSLDTGRSSNDGVAGTRTRWKANDEVSLDNSSSSNDADGLSAAPAPKPAPAMQWKAPPAAAEAWKAPHPYKTVPKQCPAGEWRAAAPPPYKAGLKQCSAGTWRAAPNPPLYKEPPKEGHAGTWKAAPKKAPPEPWGA